MSPVTDARTRERVGNLPGDVTSFVGRRSEITRMRQLLTSSHLVTLVGPGGVGKTRLAVHVAGNLQRRFFRDGAWLVDLAELRDPSLLASTVAATFGLHDQSWRTAADVVVSHLQDRDLLLVLDNCEHLLAESAKFVDTLIRSCSDLRVIATSRQSLGVPGENTLTIHPFRVPPLPSDSNDTEPAEVLEQYASVRLFLDRAKEVLPDFTLDAPKRAPLVRLCHRLDGIPLAIELAAVRLRALSLEQIEERLGDRYQLLTANGRRLPERHQALAALIDWSYDLCTHEEQLAWARASVFSGSFDLAAAEHVISGDELVSSDVLGVIDSLVDKSVLSREDDDGSVRFRLLETVRQYGQQKLAEFGASTAVARRHRDWYLRLAERFEAEWLGPDQAAWVARLSREHPNLRAALEFCVTEPGEGVAGLRLAAAVEEYWWMRGVDAEARHWITEALDAAPDPTPERATALRVGGWFALLQGDYAAASSFLGEAATLAEQLGVKSELAYMVHTLGARALFSGDLTNAVTFLDDAVQRFQTTGVLRGELFATFLLGLALGIRGERDRAARMLDAAVAKCDRLGESVWRACALWSLSQTELVAGSLDRAEQVGKEALRSPRQTDNKLAIAFAINTLAWIAERQDRHDRAATLFGAAEALWQAIGASPLYAKYAAANDEYMKRARAALGQKNFEVEFGTGQRMPVEAMIDFAMETRRSPVRAAATTDVRRMPLTKREREIAELVAQGMTNKEIAKKLYITQRTTEAHVQHILTKLDFNSRAQIAAWMTDAKSEQ